MSNVNCLEGWKCPECGSEGPFWVRGARLVADVLMSDDGAVDENVDSTDWEENSIAECSDCAFEGEVKDFKANTDIIDTF